MKSKRRREVALKVIKQMKPDKLYIAKELAAEAEISRAKRLTPPEMAGVLQEAKKLGIVEYVRIGHKGYWRKIGESELNSSSRYQILEVKRCIKCGRKLPEDFIARQCPYCDGKLKTIYQPVANRVKRE